MSIKYFLNKKAFVPNVFGVISIPQPEEYRITDDEMFGDIKKDIQNYILGQGTSHEIKEYDYSNTMEEFIVFNELGSKDCNRVTYHFFQIICNRYSEAVFCIRCSKRHKIWVNGSLFTVTNRSEHILLVKLEKGSNTIAIETGWSRPGDNFFIRVSAYEYECEEGNGNRLINSTLRDLNDMKFLCYDSNCLLNGESFRFILFSNNTITFDVFQKVYMELFDSDTGEIFENREIEFGKEITIKSDGLYYKNSNTLNYLRLKLTYRSTSGENCIIRIPVFLYDITEGINYYYNIASNLLQSDSITPYDRLCIQYKLDVINMENPASNIDNILSLIGNIKSIEAGNHMDSTIYSAGSKRVFFKSSLDNRAAAYHAYTPKNYNKNKQYPLIIHISTYSLTNYSQYYKNFLKEDVISVDISQRGFTMGSYIGEAAILEAIDDIFKKFSINRHRVYLLGHSNGAYAVWTMAQAYPHMFAGALIISGGVNNKLISNMKNMKVISISSSHESGYAKAYRRIAYSLKKNHSSEMINLNQHCHNTLMFDLSNSDNISKLLLNESDDYPMHIEYCTCFNRHRRAYWVEIHSILRWGKYAKIKVDVSGDNIYIKTHNITGATIYIPPYMNKDAFHLIVNNNDPVSIRTDQKCVSFFIKNKNVIIGESDIKPQLYRGAGLLDVYLGPVTVVPTFKKLDKIAHMLAKPYSNGVNPVLQITYPIVHINNLDQESRKRNLIIIDCNCTNKYIRKIRGQLPIQMDKDGYRIRNKSYEGRYCIMAVTANPENPDAAILYINSNDRDIMLKNFFIRKMILPSYSNGYHPYLNNEVLVFDDDGYKVYNS